MNIEEFETWILRCMTLNLPAIYGGLKFGLENDEVKCTGLDLAGLEQMTGKGVIKSEFIKIEDKEILIHFPYQMLVNWKSVSSDIVSLLKIVVYKEAYAYTLTVSGLSEFSDFEDIGIYKCLNLEDVIILRKNALLNAKINCLKAPKVTVLEDNCLCGCNNIVSLDLSSINYIDTLVMKNLRSLINIEHLKLSDNYIIGNVDSTILRNGKDKVYMILDVSQFTELHLQTLHYLFSCRLCELNFDNLTTITMNGYLKSLSFYNNMHVKNVDKLCFGSLIEVPSFMFVKHKFYPIIELPKVEKLNSNSFFNCCINKLYMPSVNCIQGGVFVNTYINECYLTGVKEIDLSLFYGIKNLYLSKDAVVKNDCNYSVKVHRVDVS